MNNLFKLPGIKTLKIKPTKKTTQPDAPANKAETGRLPTLADLEGVRRKPRPKDYGKATTPAQKRHPSRILPGA